jgi:hypothetical protein
MLNLIDLFSQTLYVHFSLLAKTGGPAANNIRAKGEGERGEVD